MDFRIEFPPEWNVSHENRNGTAVQGVSPASSGADVGAIAMVRHFNRSKIADLPKIAETLIVEMSKHYKNFKLLNNSNFQIGSIKALRIEYVSDYPGSTQVFKHADYLLLDEDRGYLIMTGAPLSEISKFENELNGIVRSFEFHNARNLILA